MSDLPPRLREAEWKRWVERELRRLRQGLGGSAGLAESVLAVYDENGVARVRVGQIGTESSPTYGFELADEAGDPIPFGGSPSSEEGGSGSVTFGSSITSADIGDTTNAGTGTSAARDNHQHAFPAPAAGYPVDVTATETDGTATTPARSDHGHAHGVITSGDHHTEYQKESEKGAANGYLGLDSSGFISPADPFNGTPGSNSMLAWDGSRWSAGGAASDLAGESLMVASGFGPVWVRKHTRATIVFFQVTGTTAVPWTNQPAALTELFGSDLYRSRPDLSACRSARISARFTVLGATNAELRLQYSLDNTTWQYMNGAAGVSNGGTGPVLAIGSAGAGVGMQTGAWVDIHANAQVDTLRLRIIGINGDGAADPAFGRIEVEVR